MITFVIGGARSGKSRFALQLANNYVRKAYIATAQALDKEMKERIEKHKKERSGEWITYEEPINISSLIKDIHKSHDVILIDCLTLWLSNIMIRTQNTEDTKQITEHNIQEFLDTLTSLKNNVCALTSGICSLFIVSNEVGLGIVPDNALSRRFRDMSGYLNQKVAEIADDVYLVTAGIPIKIK